MMVNCFYCRHVVIIPGAPPDLAGCNQPKNWNPIYRASAECPHCGTEYAMVQKSVHGPTKDYESMRPENWEPEPKQ